MPPKTYTNVSILLQNPRFFNEKHGLKDCIAFSCKDKPLLHQTLKLECPVAASSDSCLAGSRAQLIFDFSSNLLFHMNNSI